ncbi:MAG: hypothetical protein Ct9H90mP24_1670 [Methanobacteriota archaeon]|nr:MAG: hypothetical protein Ct9H90mP24_1670 [Euryarchaeota archaeon]
MRVAVLASGGKDSTYASWWAQLQGWEVVSLVTVLVKGDDSKMFQLQNTWITAFQASSSGIPWKPIKSFGEEEDEVGDLESSITAEGDILDLKEIFPPGKQDSWGFDDSLRPSGYRRTSSRCTSFRLSEDQD